VPPLPIGKSIRNPFDDSIGDIKKQWIFDTGKVKFC
jgi:hypothetical protein